MKPFIFCTMLLATTIGMAQPGKTTITQVYAFAEEVLPGKKTVQLQQKKEVLHIYVTTTRRLSESSLAIWIRGNYYAARAELVPTKPVYRKGPGANKQLLVPATAQWVYRLKILAASNPAPRPNRELGALLQSNEVVIPYQRGTKQQFATLATIQQLESLPPL